MQENQVIYVSFGRVLSRAILGYVSVGWLKFWCLFKVIVLKHLFMLIDKRGWVLLRV